MSDTSDLASPTLFRRLANTPLSDALRGRLTGRLDVKALLASSGLPDPAKALVARVVRRTRLWRSEKADVAAELVAHFADGLDAGEPLDELLARFGDERKAARLIRRAKVRNRSILWHGFRAATFLFLTLILFYGLLAAYYFAGHPSPSVDYLEILNRPILATAPADRAWPLYRQAILDLGLNAAAKRGEAEKLNAMLDARPGTKRWPALVQWLEEHQPALTHAHQAAAKPHFGFILGPGGSATDRAVWPDLKADAPEPVGMLGAAFPSFSPIRQLARTLAADAALARERRDGERFGRDVRTLTALADHLRDHPSLVADLVSLAIRSLTLEQIDQALATSSELLTDADLQDLAHRLSRERVASDLLDVRDERFLIRDILQRLYTDGGLGGGRLTRDGIRYAALLGLAGTQGREPKDDQPSPVLQPGSLLLVKSRNEATGELEYLADRADAMLHQPIRDADWQSWYAHVIRSNRSFLTQVREFPVNFVVASFGSIHASAERYLGHRDGVLVGIACELHRRRHNAYPDSLEALVPAVLPSVPADPITGAPVRYRLVDGRPLVYSVGVDRDDDSGRPAAQINDVARWEIDTPIETPADGDWLLYPRQRESQDETPD